MQQDELDGFIKNILDEKNLSGVTEEVRVQLHQDLRENLLDQINQALIAALPDDSLDSFNALIDNEATSEQQIQYFITAQGVDIRQTTVDTMLKFAQLYLGNVAEKE